MTYLLDTTMLSESQRDNANAGVRRWLEEQNPSALYTSVLCIGEIWRGVTTMPGGRRRDALRAWIQSDVHGMFGDRILALTRDIAARWGEMVGRLELDGRRPPTIDSLIAATALVHNLTVVTRNTRDFERCGVPVLNPWTT